MTFSFNVILTTTGWPLERAIGDRSRKLENHLSFSRRVIEAFSGVIETTAPRDTGYMATYVSAPSFISSDGEFVGYGAGSYDRIGDPGKRAKKGTIKTFVKDYPNLRGHRPMISTAAWWYLSKAGKDKLRSSRLHDSYGGGKPAYWYAIARGLVPDASGGTLPANIFVDYAVDFANSERQILAKLYFGG